MTPLPRADGYGTRLYPLTRNTPKALLPVAGRPVLDYLMDALISLDGLGAIHLVTNARFCGHFEAWRDGWRQRLDISGIDLTVHNDGTKRNAGRLGACVDLKLVFERIEAPEGMLVAAGDNIFNFDLRPLWSTFRRVSHHLVVALPEMDPARLRKTGVPVFGEDDRVEAIAEKTEQPPSFWFCPPLYFLKPSAIMALDHFLAAVGAADAPGYFMDFLCRTEKVYAIRLNATRLDIGDKASYRQADCLLTSGRAACLRPPWSEE